MTSSGHRWSFALRILRRAFGSFVRTSAAKGHLEVERKFRISEEEAASLPGRYQAQGFAYAGTALMTDSFLPTVEKGEMMRVRRERIDDGPTVLLLTQKKWVATSTGKERQETERSVPAAVAVVWLFIGRFIKGAPLLSFSKERQLYDGKLVGSDAVASIDKVEGLGKYSGFYMEIEVLVPLGQDPKPFEQAIFAFAEQVLGESREFEKMSYQDMLKASRQE